MTSEQRQFIGLDCVICGTLIDGIATGDARFCRSCDLEIANAPPAREVLHESCFVGRPSCVECDGLGLTYCGFCKDGLYDGKPCLMCRGESVVDCFCVPDTDDQCKPLYVPFNS